MESRGGVGMNLLFIFYIPSGGMETLNRQRCIALKKRGVNCHLLYLQSGSGIQNIHGIPTVIFDNDHEIKSYLNKGHFDAIIVTSHYLMLPRLRNLGYQGPLIYEVQGLGSIQSAKSILQDAVPIITNSCNAVLYPRTPHLAKLFEILYPTVRKFSFHNCIDADNFHYRCHPKLQHPILGWVGRIEENKNWRSFLEIGHNLIQINPSIRLWMFLDDSLSQQEKAFQETVHQLKLTSLLHLHSNIPHQKMMDYYSMIGDSGGFLCSTSITEGFGYAAVEAMCCKCPVMSTDSDGVKSYILHNVTGKIFKDRIDAFNHAQELMNNLGLRETIRLSAQRLIKKEFSPTSYCNHFIAMLNDLGTGNVI
jgi:glycosyltransferase involved in cell wall biosynthesis